MRTLLMVLAGIAVPCGGLLLLVFLAQDRFIYIPLRGLDGTPADAGLRFEDVVLTADDGVALHGWFVPAPAAETRTVLLLHGNAGNISHRLDKVAALWRAGLAVLVVDYRGYGKSEGRPSEEGLLRDARAAWDHLVGTRGVPPERVVLYGESLGCAPALRLAASLERAGAPPGVLVLEAPFSSAAEMSRLVLPWLPVGWLLRSRFDNLEEAARVTIPALVLAGAEDEVVPVAMGRRVHAALGSSSTELHIEPDAGHNDLWMGREDRLAALVARFAREGRPAAGD